MIPDLLNYAISFRFPVPDQLCYNICSQYKRGNKYGISNLRILRYIFTIPRVYGDTGKFFQIPVARRDDPDNRNDAHLFTGGVYECWTDGSAVLRILYQSYFY